MILRTVKRKAPSTSSFEWYDSHGLRQLKRLRRNFELLLFLKVETLQ